MTRKCIIEGCTSKSGNPQHRGVTFHSFPFDSKTRDIWIMNCGIGPEKNITKSVLVCSRHFRRADFQPMKSNKYFLKPGAVPTIFPWGKLDYVEPDGDPSGLAPMESNEDDEMENVLQPSDGLFTTPAKRPATDVGIDTNPPAKQAKLSLPYESTAVAQSPNLVAALQGDNNSSPTSSNIAGTSSGIRKMETITGFTPGVRLEAQDFDGVWHTARIVEVDNDEREVLIRFEKSGKSKGASGIEEWIPMNSSRLRQKPIIPSSSSSKSFILGEKCMARWSGSRKFPATVNKILANDMYEVLFDDGYVKVVKGNHISKMKTLLEKTSTPKSSPNSSSSKSKQSSNKKDWPLISISSLNLEELNLPVIPQDGEWCCHWVNDQPIGQEGFLTVGDHKKPTVIVEDWRLPPNWTKHMYQRSNVLGKWDVILVNPQGKRFRSKADLKQYIEELGQIYNPDVYDFSIHRRRAKDIGAYVFTKDYKPPSTQPPPETPTTTTTSTTVAASSPQPLPPVIQQAITTAAVAAEQVTPVKLPEEEITPLEDGYVYVGSLKVQIIDNLFRCPQEGCNKNFRKENHLQIHIKHYHDDIAKLLGVCPNMQELACKRTIGMPHEEPLPKNHLSNSQFFAKLHQQDLQLRTHRKTPAVSHLASSSPNPTATLSADSPIPSDIPANKLSEIQPIQSITESVETLSTPIIASTSPPTPTTVFSHATGDETLSFQEETIVTTNKVAHAKVPSTKAKKGSDSNRKSSRQKISKKYLTASTFESSFGDTDLEETRHSFNITPEQKVSSKKLKQVTIVPVTSSTITAATTGGDSNQDANSHTTSSIPENSQSPKYISENGEIIKIVRMKQEEIINCLCSYAEEDGLMIQCELCLCWQHGICNGIEKESQVPDKYICYICRNPQRGRSSLKYIHDQDWLYEGKLPVANYHAPPPNLEQRFDLLKRTHILTGNLLELKRFLHSLRVKINIAENKDHPKMYLWAKKWESSSPGKEYKGENEKLKMEIDGTKCESVVEGGADDKARNENNENNSATNVELSENKLEEKQTDSSGVDGGNSADGGSSATIQYQQPTIPQPEAPIDSVECQHRLLEHIQKQQTCVMDRLQTIESQIMEIESLDNTDLDTDDCTKARDTLSLLIKDLEIMKNIAKINTVQPTFVAY